MVSSVAWSVSGMDSAVAWAAQSHGQLDRTVSSVAWSARLHGRGRVRFVAAERTFAFLPFGTDCPQCCACAVAVWGVIALERRTLPL
eukprot:353822-Chlamydomonas_euryale.AAC.13